MTKNETPSLRQALHIMVYDMQGGPFPEKLREEIESAMIDIVSKYDGVAWTQKEE